MTTICVFIQDTLEGRTRINEITKNFICFVEVETIEFDYVQVTIQCRLEDAEAIERRLADLV